MWAAYGNSYPGPHRRASAGVTRILPRCFSLLFCLHFLLQKSSCFRLLLPQHPFLRFLPQVFLTLGFNVWESCLPPSASSPHAPLPTLLLLKISPPDKFRSPRCLFSSSKHFSLRICLFCFLGLLLLLFCC